MPAGLGRWLECDLYAYQSEDRKGRPLYIVHVAASAAEEFGLEIEYREDKPEAFLDRLLWLESKGCTLAPRAAAELRGEIDEAASKANV